MKKWLIVSLISVSCINVVFSEETQEKGLLIAQEVERRDQGWVDARISMSMVLQNQHGDKSTRDIRIKILEVNGDGDKSLTVFDSPRDVRGTSFLSYSHIVKPDDQWLYMPALKRVKRISSAYKSGPFMGSQFAYEDLASFEVDKYEYRYLRDEILDGIESFVVENHPNYQHSGYSRQLVWIDKQRYIPLKVEYYDRKNELLKILKLKGYRQYLDKYWRAHEQVMENQQNGKLTTLILKDNQFRNGFSEQDFQRNSLKRAK
ncbi:Outer membrane lipoprotein-sorting protein [hydrothermal vent metagenome]|uniref:Outer membrane lipoprotein-sorting protein n=1 Tax=hydrothermal vent metagenome TaxID=652676 RepID=A0A3B0XLN8_9ZZZZ